MGDDTYRHVLYSDLSLETNGSEEIYMTQFLQTKIISDDAFKDDFLRKVNSNQFRIFVPSFSFVCFLIVIGLPGNIMAILVYATQLKKGVARYFILTLAVSDLITCSCVAPLELWIMTYFWTFAHQGLCKVFRFVAYGVNNISSLILLAIAFERYRLICRPWKQKFSAKCSKVICGLVIFLAALTSAPMIFIYGTFTVPLFSRLNISTRNNSQELGNTTYAIYGKTCMLDDKMVDSLFPFYTNVVYIVATVIVFIVLVYLYGCIARQLVIQKRQNRNKQNEKSMKNYSKRIKHVTFMVLVLTCVYEICYLPCLTIICIRLASPDFYQSLNDSGKMAYQCFLKFYLINSALNPCIYCYCNREFRLGACKILNNLRIFCSRDQERKLSQSYISTGN